MATGHTPQGATLAKRGGGPSPHWPPWATPLGTAPLHGQREPATPPPRPKGATPCPAPTGQTGRPTLATLPPFGRPTGAYGHRLPHWPPTGHLLAIREAPPTGQKGRPRLATGRGRLRPALPRLAKGAGGGAFGHTGAPAPHFPATGRGGVFRVQRGAMRCCPCA